MTEASMSRCVEEGCCLMEVKMQGLIEICLWRKVVEEGGGGFTLINRGGARSRKRPDQLL